MSADFWAFENIFGLKLQRKCMVFQVGFTYTRFGKAK